jgi:phospholipid/cholesterol/gamma-HCH transport system substrate-binding protein
MENKAHALVAGVFVVITATLLALLAVWLTRDSTQRNLYEMTTNETVIGLQPQATVRFRGVPVGKVERIGFDNKIEGNVLIRISVDRAAPVTSSTFASVASQGVTGLGFIQLDDDDDKNSAPATPLKSVNGELPRIPLKPGGLSRLLKQSEAIFNQAEQVTARLNQLLSDKNQQAATTAVTQLGEAAGGLNRLAQNLEPTVAALPALAHDAGAALRSVKVVTDEVGITTRRLNQAGGPLDKLSDGGAALSAGVQTFSASTLPKLGEVADETAHTMRQLRRTVNAVDDNPQSLIFGNGVPRPGPGEPGFSDKEE